MSVEEFAKLPPSEQNAFLIETKADAEHPENVAPTTWAETGWLERSPFNREEFNPDELAKLKESVRARGVIQPLLVRPIRYRWSPKEITNGMRFERQVGPNGAWESAVDQELRAKMPGSTRHFLTDADCKAALPFLPKFEIIAGERRWMAATSEKVARVPIIVRDVDDEEAIELQGIENLQRENLNPIHEAQKYQQLLDSYHAKRKLNPAAAMDRLVQKVGKAKSTIYEALRLLKLPDKARHLVLTNVLPHSHAVLITQLEKRADLMEEATQRIMAGRNNDTGGKVLAFREAQEVVRRLKVQADNDVEFNTKRDEFVKKGNLVLSADDNKKVFPYLSDHVGGEQFIDPDSFCSAAGKNWGPAMGKHKPDPVLAKAPSGKPVIVYPKTQAIEAIKKSAPRGKKISTRISRPASAHDRAHKARMAAFMPLMGQVAAKAEQMDGPELWRFVFECVMNFGGNDSTQRVCKRRGIQAQDVYHRPEVFREQMAKRPAKEVRGAAIELLFCRFAPCLHSSGWHKQFASWCALFGVEPVSWSNPQAPPKQASGPVNTPAGRKRLADAMRARWAARRKGAAK